MRLFIFSIYILITMINCLPINIKTWESSGRVRVIHKAPMKPRKAMTGPIFNIIHHGPPPVRRQSLPLNNNDRIYFPDEVPTSEEQKSVTRSRKLDTFSDNIELPPHSNNRDYFLKEVPTAQREMLQKNFIAHTGKVANFSINIGNRHRSILDNVKGFKVKNAFESPNTVSRCSGESTYCENVPSYPYETVNKILKNFANKDFFGLEENVAEPWSRTDNNEEENFMCKSYTKIIHPQMGKTLDGSWKYIINVDDKEYVQAVKVEICKSPKKPCAMSDKFPEGIITSCKQRYMNRRLLSISNNGLPEPDIYSLPAGCSCTYKRNSQFLKTFYSK
ncbi:PREDICTED: uncharacterized protein LOC108565586 [Nicrophorus vespilloides]|uniref:Uncharacterized protein LOC108565586 n=1 Tax=Nicrophorus vespilloides TaxID=110193 RepID=A0ABM1N1B3_NICVS|nr:PREDICTED: uncharacterized protein LOC108565586 [Nicrophorus vespilloides]